MNFMFQNVSFVYRYSPIKKDFYTFKELFLLANVSGINVY